MVCDQLGRAVWTCRWVLPGALATLLACGHDTAEPSSPNPVASISVTPSSDTLILALSLQLTAVVRDSSGTPLSGYSVAWSTSDPAVATVSATGQVISVGLGVATITATTAGKTGVAVLTVAPLITITPRRPSMFAGDTVQLRALVTDANGNSIDAGPLDWLSEAPQVAAVSTSGIALGTTSGRATISARARAGRGDVVVAVLDPAPRPSREIAFLTQGTDSRSEVHTIQPDGSEEKLVSLAGEYAGQFAWSPDGSRLAITYLQHDGVGITGLYLSNADGSDPFRLYESGYAPQWSPDGSTIAFSWCSSADECAVYAIGATGGGVRILTTQSGSEESPQWSPDGRRIAYVQVELAGATLWVMDDDGGHQEQIPLPVDAFNPRWSPDGKTIAFDNGAGVWLVNADGSRARPLTANCDANGTCNQTVQYTVPDWSFDGQKIAYHGTVSNNPVFVSTVSGDVLAQGGEALCCASAPVPQWSPDGALISYFGTQPTPPPWPGVAVMAGDATGSQFITGPQNALATVQSQNPGGGKRWRP